MDRRAFLTRPLTRGADPTRPRPRPEPAVTGRRAPPFGFLAPDVSAWIAALAPVGSEPADFAAAAPIPPGHRPHRTDLAPRAGASPLTPSEYRHLLRRAGFGPPGDPLRPEELPSAESAVDALLDERWLEPVAPPREAENWLYRPIYHGDDPTLREEQSRLYFRAWYWIALHWIRNAQDPGPGLRERMVLFWMNHFVVTAEKVYYPQILYRYIDAFRRAPWGNFRRLVKDVTIAPAMLVYLDGANSPAEDPNENYARELLELFTLGVTDRDGKPNYTESDVKAVARALTGWTLDDRTTGPVILPAVYTDANHNAAPATPFGAPPANYGLADSGGPVVDVIDLLFERKGAEIAWFLCEKLYREFVYHRTDGAGERAVITELAELLRASDWELRPVLHRLFTSAHFFDPTNVGVRIKSPLEFLLGLVRTLGVPVSDDGVAGSIYYLASFAGMTLLMPPNVKGWVGQRRWLSSTTLPLRNVVVSTNLAIGGRVGNSVDDGNGNRLEPLLLSDAGLLEWARRRPHYSAALDAFLDDLIEALCARPPSKRVRDNILAKPPPNAYEWPGLSDAEKLPTIRLFVNEILLLAEYQLA